MNENLAKTRFVYINDFDFQEDFTVKHCVGSTLITNEYLNKLIVSDNAAHYQVFSFGVGVLLIYDLYGNVYSIVPTSGLIDANAFLKIFSRTHSKGDRIFYDSIWEFYRVTENDTDYHVSIDFLESAIRLRYNERVAVFDEFEFIRGLLLFADDIIELYDNRYPLFLQSPIRSEIIELKEKVKEKYFNKNDIISY